MRGLKVVKFGGTAVADAARVRAAAGILLQDSGRRAVIVSAPGAINGKRKITDVLLDLADKKGVQGNMRELEERLCGIALDLNLPREVRQDISRLIMERMEREADPLLAVGEKISAMLMAAHLRSLGKNACCLDPEEFIIAQKTQTGKVFVDHITYPRIRNAVARALEAHEIAVIPGFYAGDLSGDIRTFPRGGSDYTAAVVAAAVGAALHENFTDVDGIRAVDPKIIPDAVKIERMTLRELAELTLGGSFGVFQSEAVGPLARAGIPIHLRNALNPSGTGTMVLPSTDGEPDRVVTGIAYRGNYTRINLLEYGMGEKPGVLARISEIAAGRGISIEHMPTTRIMASVIINSRDLPQDELGHEMERAIDADAADISRDIGLVSVVGQKLEGIVGLGERILRAIAAQSINVVFMEFMGMNFTLGVRNGDAHRAVRALYDEFFRRQR